MMYDERPVKMKRVTGNFPGLFFLTVLMTWKGAQKLHVLGLLRQQNER